MSCFCFHFRFSRLFDVFLSFLLFVASPYFIVMIFIITRSSFSIRVVCMIFTVIPRTRCRKSKIFSSAALRLKVRSPCYYWLKWCRCRKIMTRRKLISFRRCWSLLAKQSHTAVSASFRHLVFKSTVRSLCPMCFLCFS